MSYTNWGVASAGGVANDSGGGNNTGDFSDYDIAWANDGLTAGSRYDGNDAHCHFGPVGYATEITLAASKPISRVICWFNDQTGMSTDPGDSDTAADWAPVDFTIDTWNGSTWDTQATVTGNDKLKRTFDFAPVTTDLVRLNVTTGFGVQTSYALQEIEVDEDVAAATTGAGTSAGVGAVSGATNLGTAASAGVAVASGVGGRQARAQGTSWARAHATYIEHALGELDAFGATIIGGFVTSDVGATPTRDDPDNSGYAIDPAAAATGLACQGSNSITDPAQFFRITLPSPLPILGVVIESSSSVGTTGTLAIGLWPSSSVLAVPAAGAPWTQGTNHSPLYATQLTLDEAEGITPRATAWASGLAVNATNYLRLADNELFDRVQVAQQVDIAVQLSHNATRDLYVSNIALLVAAKVETIAVESIGAETSTLVAVHGQAWESTGEVVTVYDPTEPSRTAYVGSVGAGVATVVEIVRTVARASAPGAADVAGIARTVATLTSSCAASATAVDWRTLTASSAAVLGSALLGVLVHAEESSGEAQVEITGEGATTQSEESSGAANATVIGVRRVTVTEESGSIAAESLVDSGAAVIALVSSGAASALSQTTSVQSETLEATAFAENFMRMPFVGSYPIFWANSLSTGAATWEGLPFNSLVAVDDALFAAGPDGLFRLIEVDDDIPAEVEWDLRDEGSAQKKRGRSVYVSGKAKGPFTIRIANEQGIFDYATHAVETETLTNHRAPMGRGLSARQMRLSLLQAKPFTAETVGIGLIESTRRI